MSKRSTLFLMIFTACLISGNNLFSEEKGEAERIIKEAVAKEPTNDGQVGVLIKLAWFDPSVAPEVSQQAKEEIRKYGQWGKFMLNKTIRNAPASVQKEMIPILLWAYEDAKLSFDLDYVATFTYLLRMTDPEVRKMAMDAFARYAIPQGILPITDAAYEDPSLEMHTVKTLGSIPHPKSARYLVEKLASPDKNIADAAEDSLSKMRVTGSLEIKKGLSLESKATRERCLKLFLPIATVDDIPLLNHIRFKKENFDAELLEQLDRKIEELNEQQALMQQMEQQEETVPPPEKP